MFFLAIHLDSNHQQIALIRKEKAERQIIHLRTLSSDVKPLDILQPVLEGKSFDIITGLSSSDILLRNLSLKLTAKREILSALPFQVEDLLPYPEDEVILLPTLFPSKEKGTDVFLLGTAKKTVKSHLETLSFVELDPDTVSCTPLALFRFARHYFPRSLDLCVHHLGEIESLFIIIKEGKLHSSHTQNFGYQDLIKEDSHAELKRMVAYLQTKNPEIETILLTGAPATLPHLEEFSLLDLENHSLKEYALPIGLALDAAAHDKQSGQFRQEQEVSKTKIQKNRRLFTKYFATCLSCLLTILILGNAGLKRKERAILQTIEAPKGIRLSEAVARMKKELSSQKNATLTPITTPTVTTVLSWLSTHPALSEKCTIKHLRYQLVKIPKLGSSIKSALGKVELEIETKNAKSARIFHEALLKDTEIIDQKQEIKWKLDHGIYRTSFYLKKGVRT